MLDFEVGSDGNMWLLSLKRTIPPQVTVVGGKKRGKEESCYQEGCCTKEGRWQEEGCRQEEGRWQEEGCNQEEVILLS